MKILILISLLFTGCVNKYQQKTLIVPNSNQVIKQDHDQVKKLMKIYNLKNLKAD